MAKRSYSPPCSEELRNALSEAQDVAELYTELVNNMAKPLLAVGPILMALYCPGAIGQESPASKDELMEAVRAYSEVCADFELKYRLRNYNFFGKGHYVEYVKALREI